MKITYEFVTGAVEIEVSDDWGEILVELDRIEHNVNQTETRRHEHLDTSSDKSERMVSDDQLPLEQIISDDEQKQLFRKLEGILTEKQMDAVRMICFEGYTEKKYAEKSGISQNSAHMRLAGARKKLKKLF